MRAALRYGARAARLTTLASAKVSAWVRCSDIDDTLDHGVAGLNRNQAAELDHIPALLAVCLGVLLGGMAAVEVGALAGHSSVPCVGPSLSSTPWSPSCSRDVSQ